VSDNANGTYTATITNSPVETVTVTAAFGGSNVGDTVNVNFIKSEIFDSQAGIATTTHSMRYRSLLIVLQNRSQTSLLLDRQSLGYCR
jgi:hypothetical protein